VFFGLFLKVLVVSLCEGEGVKDKHTTIGFVLAQGTHQVVLGYLIRFKESIKTISTVLYEGRFEEL
jgi:hypothetical protein